MRRGGDAYATVGCGHFALADLADAHKFSLIFNSASRSVIWNLPAIYNAHPRRN